MVTSSPFFGLSEPLPSLRTFLVTPIVAVDRSCGDVQRSVGVSWLRAREMVEGDSQVRGSRFNLSLEISKLASSQAWGREEKLQVG